MFECSIVYMTCKQVLGFGKIKMGILDENGLEPVTDFELFWCRTLKRAEDA
jgi:hypothetical protein